MQAGAIAALLALSLVDSWRTIGFANGTTTNEKRVGSVGIRRVFLFVPLVRSLFGVEDLGGSVRFGVRFGVRFELVLVFFFLFLDFGLGENR
jgi:hypothetical protein